MKTKLLLTLILLTISFFSSAQGIRFIVFADPQVSWLKPEVRQVENAGIRGSINAGFELDNFFSSNYAFSTGLSLSNIGGKLKFNEAFTVRFEDSEEVLDPGNIIIYRLQYVNLPLGLKFTTREIGYTTIFAKLGVGGHFNIKSNANISALGINDESLLDEIQLFNMSYHFGLGIQYSLGGQTAVVSGIEYRHRFLDIASNNQYKALLNSLSLRIGILF